MPGGVAVELVHNFSLIHDDIIDTDTERHHRPTVWSVYGIGPAIVAGDALQILAHQVLLESPSGRGAAASAALADATAAMIAGQADDIAFETRRDVTVEQCMAMSAAKTGALLGCAASIGAILAGAPDATVGALRDYGRHLGLAFQAVDDLLGIWGDPSRTGKPAGSDLRQRKKSMPVVSALAAGGPECRRAAGPHRWSRSGRSGRAARCRPDRPGHLPGRGLRRPGVDRGAGQGQPGRRPRRLGAGAPLGDPSPRPGGHRGVRGGAGVVTALAAEPTRDRSGPAGCLTRRGSGSPPPAAAPRGLVEGRAGDQRHHGRRGPHAPPLPRDPRSGGGGGVGPVDPGQPARRRHLGHFLRRPRRPVDDHRGLRGAAPGRRRPSNPRHAAPRPRGYAPTAASRPAGCSPGSGWRSWAGGTGKTCRCCRRRSCSCPRGPRSTSTTSAAGPGRRSWPSPLSWPTGRPVRCPSPSTSFGSQGTGRRAPVRRAGPAAAPPAGGSWLWTGSCTSTNDCPPRGSPAASSAKRPCGGPSSGSCSARRPTGCGAASNRPSSTRSSPCTCRATRSTTP